MEEIAFREGETKNFETLIKSEMQKPILHFEKELASIRTGRASITLLESIKVEAYGQVMTLKEVASLSAPEPRMLTVQPWDKSIIVEIEKAITNSDLGAAPVNDGNFIRIQLPQMTAGRRDELKKLVGKKTEECRVGIRLVRKDFHNEVRDAQKKKIISEDFAMKLSDILQKITDQFIKTADDIQAKKTTELGTI